MHRFEFAAISAAEAVERFLALSSVMMVTGSRVATKCACYFQFSFAS
jgi:hypothetical protein